jgi:hypothetical protein
VPAGRIRVCPGGKASGSIFKVTSPHAPQVLVKRKMAGPANLIGVLGDQRPAGAPMTTFVDPSLMSQPDGAEEETVGHFGRGLVARSCRVNGKRDFPCLGNNQGREGECSE